MGHTGSQLLSNAGKLRSKKKKEEVTGWTFRGAGASVSPIRPVEGSVVRGKSPADMGNGCRSMIRGHLPAEFGLVECVFFHLLLYTDLFLPRVFLFDFGPRSSTGEFSCYREIAYLGNRCQCDGLLARC